MSLGLDGYDPVRDAIVGVALVLGIGLTGEVAKWLGGVNTDWRRRFLVYASAATVMRLAWWLTFDHSYFPTTEVVTAVAPALQHPYSITWQAPYGILWYWLNQPLMLPWTLISSLSDVELGYLWMAGLAVADVPFYYLLRKSELLTAYLMSSLFIWAVVPWNLTILHLTVLGFFVGPILPRLALLALPVIAKLPIGAPLAVWKYDFVDGMEGGTVGSAFVPGHLMPYAMLGAWWLAAVLWHYKPMLLGPLGWQLRMETRK